MKGYSSGQLSMPSYGAGTANSEFELITGMNLDHFGAAEYPYKNSASEYNDREHGDGIEELRI